MRKRAANRRKTAIYWPYEPSWDYDPDLEMWSAETDDGFLLMINKYWDGYEQDGYEMQIDYPSGSTSIYWGDNEMKLIEQADYILNQYRGVDTVTSRKANMRKRAYGYWEPIEDTNFGTVEFSDLVPVDVLEGKGEHLDGVYPFDAQLFIDDVTWDEYDENESYTWGFIIYEDGSYEWGDYYDTFTGSEWEAQIWADGIIQKFVDDYESGMIIPENMDYYLTFLD